MPKLLRNALALLLALVVGSCVNMALISIGPMLIPPPAGVDVRNAESLRQGIHLFEARHYLTPFLAHALGSLAGACVACLLAASHRRLLGWVVGAVFLCGGVAAAFMIPAPAWFIAADLLLAYLPMAWLGLMLSGRLRPAA